MPPKPQLTPTIKQKIELAKELSSDITELKVHLWTQGIVYRVKQVSDTKKRKTVSKYEMLDESILFWIKKARYLNCIVTGPIIQAVANKLARRSNIPETEFKASRRSRCDDEEVCDTGVACIKAYEDAHMVYELEKFFTANSMLEDASWAVGT